MIRRVAAAVATVALCTAAFAQSPFLVADINRDAVFGSDAKGFHVVGNRAFFYASTPYHGRELWRTDGTAFGTAMVKEMNPGWGDGICSCGAEIADLNGTVYFVPNDNNLWKTDGSDAGTQLAFRLSSGVTNLTSDGNHLYFTTRGGELWVSDGTQIGTHALSTAIAGVVRATSIMPGDGVTYFTGNSEQNTTVDSLFRTDGSVTTRMNANPFEAQLTTDYAWVGSRFYLAIGTQLLKVDANSDTPKSVFSVAPTAPDHPHHLVRAGNGVYFVAPALDGTSLAVQRLDVATDAVSVVLPITSDASLTPLGDRVVILAEQPWITDGTAAGTQRLAEDIAPVSSAGNAVAVGSFVYFGAASNAIFPGPYEGIFRTDGTRSGTTPVFLGVFAQELTRFGDTLLFSGNGEPWRSDGTAAGTTRIRQLAPTTSASSPRDLTVVGSSLFFRAESSNSSATRVWRTDGYNTAALTTEQSIADVGVPCHGGVLFTGCVMTNECGLFAADAAGRITTVTRGYRSFDGGCAGNHAVVREDVDILSLDLDRNVATILPIVNSSNYATLGGRVFFTVDNDIGTALMQTDGTKEGTSTLLQTDTYLPSTDFAFGGAVNGKLLYQMNGINAVPLTGGPPVSLSTRAFFGRRIDTGTQLIFDTNVDGQEQLWATDGTPNGTTVLGNLSSGLLALAASNGRVYVLDGNGVISMTNGTPGNLQHVADSRDTSTITSANGLVYFTKRNADGILQLWVSDGTVAGTHAIGGTPPSDAQQLVATDRLLFFTATDPYDGNELWALPIAGQGQPHRHAIR